MIHKDEYRDWKNHPVTDVFFNTLEDIVLGLEDAMLAGHSLDSHPHMAQQLGLIRAYRSVIEYSPEFNEDGFMIDDLENILE